jgi:uncharacterized protein YdhG (YjbR/CyaY superfamily)
MDKAIEEYLASVPADRQGLVEALHRLITALYPDAAVSMKYKMPTYEAGEGWVALANQKRYVSLYTCSAEHIETFKKKHPKVRTGTACINLRATDPLPVDDLKAVIRHAIDHPKGR